MSPKKISSRGEPLVANLSGIFRSVCKDVESFRGTYPGWLEKWEDIGPVYRLPRQCVIGLKRPPAGKRPILDNAAAEVEMAFTDLCQAFSGIGYWKGRLIEPGYLVRPGPLPKKRDLAKLGWTQAEVRSAERLVEKTDSISPRLKGYVGWLVTDPDFIEARDNLASQWKMLDKTKQPFPIQRSIQGVSPPKGARRAKGALARYQVELDGFLDRWGLIGMLTWDLPQPQGPMLPAPLPVDAPAIPKHGLHLVLPIHYPLTTTDDLLRQIHQQQIQLAKNNGLDPSMAGLRHFEVFGQMLEVDFLETTIGSRYGTPGRRGGFVIAMEHAIAETLDISVNQVQKLRKGISACRRGKRSSVRWLKTDVR